MISFVLEHIVFHPLAWGTGLVVGALVPGIKLWLLKRAQAAAGAVKAAV